MEETLTNEQLLALLEEVAIETINDYNGFYGENKQLDEDTFNYLLAFAVVTLFGYNSLFGRSDIPEDTKTRVLDQFPSDYKGIQDTTRKELINLEKKLGRLPTAQELNDFRLRRLQSITEAVEFNTANQLTALYAEQDGRNIVAGVTVGDERVRPQHVRHNGKYWRATSYQPWNDYNCRCTYVYFKSRGEARQAGFNEL